MLRRIAKSREQKVDLTRGKEISGRYGEEYATAQRMEVMAAIRRRQYWPMFCDFKGKTEKRMGGVRQIGTHDLTSRNRIIVVKDDSPIPKKCQRGWINLNRAENAAGVLMAQEGTIPNKTTAERAVMQAQSGSSWKNVGDKNRAGKLLRVTRRQGIAGRSGGADPW
jgi:hypothetical protein